MQHDMATEAGCSEKIREWRTGNMNVGDARACLRSDVEMIPKSFDLRKLEVFTRRVSFIVERLVNANTFSSRHLV